MRLIGLVVFLLGCPAEDFGVHVPSGGIDSINNEDLQRDVWSLTRGSLSDRRVGMPGHEEGLEMIRRRLLQMRTLPAVGSQGFQSVGKGYNLCTIREGRGDQHVLLSVTDVGQGAYLSASSIAGLIGLAKSLDTPGRPAHSVVFCVFAGERGKEAFVAAPLFPVDTLKSWIEIGPLGLPGELSWVEKSDVLRRVTVEGASTPEQGIVDDLDFRILLKQIGAVHDIVSQVLQAP